MDQGGDGLVNRLVAVRNVKTGNAGKPRLRRPGMGVASGLRDVNDGVRRRKRPALENLVQNPVHIVGILVHASKSVVPQVSEICHVRHPKLPLQERGGRLSLKVWRGRYDSRIRPPPKKLAPHPVRPPGPNRLCQPDRRTDQIVPKAGEDGSGVAWRPRIGLLRRFGGLGVIGRPPWSSKDFSHVLDNSAYATTERLSPPVRRNSVDLHGGRSLCVLRWDRRDSV
jgi:hypothetical protein